MFVLSALLVTVAVFWITHKPSTSQFLSELRGTYFSKAVWAHVSAIADYKYYFVNGILYPLIFTPIILSGAWLAVSLAGGLTVLFGARDFVHADAAIVNAAYTVVFFFARDLGLYLGHWVQHRFDFLWQFHKVHHSAEVLTPITNFRVHPVDLLSLATGSSLCTGPVTGVFMWLFADQFGFFMYFGLHVALVVFLLVGKVHDEILAMLAETFQITPKIAADYFAIAISQWQGTGVLEGGQAAPIDMPPQAVPKTLKKPLPPASNLAFHTQRHYRLLDTFFRVQFTTAEQESWVHPVLNHLEASVSCHAETRIHVTEACGKLIVYVDEQPTLSCARIAELAPLVKAAVWQIAVRNHNFFLDIHAGVVGDGRQCILFPAPPGHGKSMLTAALSKAGMQYFSDEVALIEGGSFLAYPVNAHDRYM